jgi:hypothetical protein
MGAVKQFYSECAEAGRCPVSRETLDYLDDVECGLHTGRQIDWIGYAEHEGEECITIESARRLLAEGLANDEVAFFVECFGDFAPANRCPSAATTAARLAGEIVAAVAAGEELPDEWHRLDAYAGIGEPIAEEVCRLVREELEGTGIRP